MKKFLQIKQRPTTMLTSFHFHEMSDIISEEDSFNGLQA